MKKRWATSPAFTAGVRQATASEEPPSNVEAELRITEWLARLRNLHGVPFYLLVPDVRMLPQESIRMFRLDENWVECLIDGAFSLGDRGPSVNRSSSHALRPRDSAPWLAQPTGALSHARSRGAPRRARASETTE